jgi:hypothetical protein
VLSFGVWRSIHSFIRPIILEVLFVVLKFVIFFTHSACMSFRQLVSFGCAGFGVIVDSPSS